MTAQIELTTFEIEMLRVISYLDGQWEDLLERFEPDMCRPDDAMCVLQDRELISFPIDTDRPIATDSGRAWLAGNGVMW